MMKVVNKIVKAVKTIVTKFNSSILADVLKNILNSYKNTIRKNFGKIGTAVQLVVPVGLSMLSVSVLAKLALSCLFLFVVRVIKEVDSKMNNRHYDGLPVPRERFTHVDSNGFAEFTTDSIQDVLMYMTELEEFFVSKGIMK